jgi:hypothetical protein
MSGIKRNDGLQSANWAHNRLSVPDPLHTADDDWNNVEILFRSQARRNALL